MIYYIGKQEKEVHVMTVDTNVLVPMTDANQNFSKVVRLVDETGLAVIMKNNKRIIFGLVLAMGLVLGGFRQAAAQEKEEPKTFEAFYVEGMKTHEGVFPVYEQDKKVYLEIPARLLEREIFFSSRMLKGTDGNLQYGPSIGVAFFRMDAEGRLSLNSSVAVETSTDTTSAVYRVLEETRLPSVGELYPVVAYGRDGKSPIIEITS